MPNRKPSRLLAPPLDSGPLLPGVAAEVYLRRWLWEVARPSVRPATAAHYATIVHSRLVPWLGPLPLHELRADAIQAYLAGELARGRAPSTVRQTLRVLGVALERAR